MLNRTVTIELDARYSVQKVEPADEGPSRPQFTSFRTKGKDHPVDILDALVSCSTSAQRMFLTIKDNWDRKTGLSTIPRSMPDSMWYPAVKELVQSKIVKPVKQKKRINGHVTFIVNPDGIMPWPDDYHIVKEHWNRLP